MISHWLAHIVEQRYAGSINGGIEAGRRHDMVKPFVFWLVISIMLFGPAAAANRYADTNDRPHLKAHFINVGKGDVTLLEFPCGTVMFDAGGGEDSEAALKGYLDEFFRKRPERNNRLDLVVLSHGHMDHTRNIGMIMDNYEVGQLMTNGHRDKPGYASLEDILARHPDVPHLIVEQSLAIPTGGLSISGTHELGCTGGPAADLRLLWGATGSKPKVWGKKRYADENNHSIAMMVFWGTSRTLLTGDMERESLALMLERQGSILQQVDLYQISHHGFRSGTLPEFDEHVSPRIAILSREGGRAWHGPTMERFDKLLRKQRNPVRVPVWTFEESGYDMEELDESMANDIDLGKSRERKRIPGTAVMTGAIYWTGRDGSTVVRLRPNGRMSVRTKVKNR